MRKWGWIWGCLATSSHAARSTKDSSERSRRARPRSRGKLDQIGVFYGFSVVKSCLIGVDDLALSGQGLL